MAKIVIDNEYGQVSTQEIGFISPELVSGWWSSDAEGNNKLVKAYLEETVYFHVETRGIKEGKELKLKLYDYDRFLFNDWINPDDDEFPDKEIHKTAKVNIVNGKYVASVKLELDPSWAIMIKQDAPPFKQIDLYWEVSCDELFFSHDLPKFQTDYLRVRHSKRDLYIKTYDNTTQLPEMVSTNGGLVLLFNMAKGEVIGDVKDKIVNWAEKTITKVALGKLEKGYLMSNTGTEYQVTSRVVNKNIYTNDGTIIKDAKQAKNMGNGFYTTKGISQYDYYATQGVRVKILGVLKELGNIFDLLDLANFAREANEKGLDHSKPLSIPLGVLTPLNNLAGVIISDMVADIDETHEAVFQQELAKAKEEGLEAVERLVSNNSFGYVCEPVRSNTAQKLIQGKYINYEELLEFDSSEEARGEDVYILRKNMKHPLSLKDITIIETIFINE